MPWHYEMVGGVMAVYADSTKRQLLFAPPGSAVDFFTDMHWWAWRATFLGVDARSRFPRVDIWFFPICSRLVRLGLAVDFFTLTCTGGQAG